MDISKITLTIEEPDYHNYYTKRAHIKCENPLRRISFYIDCFDEDGVNEGIGDNGLIAVRMMVNYFNAILVQAKQCKDVPATQAR